MRTWSPAQTIPAAEMRKGPRLTTTLNLTQQGRDRRAAEQPGPQPAPLTPPIVLGDLRQLWAKASVDHSVCGGRGGVLERMSEERWAP